MSWEGGDDFFLALVLPMDEIGPAESKIEVVRVLKDRSIDETSPGCHL